MATAVKKYDHLSAEIRREGEALILPEVPAPSGMTYNQAIEALQKRRDSEEAEVAVAEFVPGYAPLDAARAFMVAMARKFGWVDSVTVPGGFWHEDEPPTYVSLRIGPKPSDTTRIIWGRFVIPGIAGNLNTAMAPSPETGQLSFVVHGKTQRKYQSIIADLMNLTREVLQAESIYRGRAVRLPLDKNGKMDWNKQLQFMDTTATDPAAAIFSVELSEQIEVNLFTPVKHTDTCRRLKIPLKRGVLLEGTYGTGKTLVATVLAKVCEDNAWTFVLVPDARGLAEAVDFAKRYSPAVVFCEDIDRQMEGERSIGMDSILNTIDGIGAKSTEVMVVLTTNHVDKINPAMLRPGRLDSVISVTPPDAHAARRLVRLYGRKLIPGDDMLVESGALLAGMIPAVIREVVERAKLAAVYRSGNEFVSITDADLVLSAKGMQKHLGLLEHKPEAMSDAEVLAEKLHKVIGNGTAAVLEDMHDHVREIHKAVV